MPIAAIARSEFMLVVHPSLPVYSVQDLIALAKKHPGELNYATSSTGGPTHLAPVQFEMLAGIRRGAGLAGEAGVVGLGASGPLRGHEDR